MDGASSSVISKKKENPLRHFRVIKNLGCAMRAPNAKLRSDGGLCFNEQGDMEAKKDFSPRVPPPTMANKRATALQTCGDQNFN